jgi:diacylglycerol kinase family enzyme
LSNIVLINPRAGSGAALRVFEKRKSSLPVRHQVVMGASPEDTERLAAQAAASEANSLTIVGGDGTIHHALNGFLSAPHTKTKLAILPAGTANDYVASLRDLASSSATQNLRVDVGVVRCQEFQRYFLNVAGLGLTAHTALVSRPSRWLPARIRYTVGLFRTLVFGWQYVDTRIQLSDEVVREDQLLTLSVAIGKREGSFVLAPDAQLDDGLFNLLVVSSLRRHDLCRYLPGLLLGKLPQHDARIRYRVEKELQLKSKTPLYLHLDGEVYGTGTLPAQCDIQIKHARHIEIELVENNHFKELAV